MSLGLTLEERYEGCFFGLAIGDALGYPTEFLSLEEIRKKYGSQGVTDLAGVPALHSDDTQMAMAVAKAVLQTGNGDLPLFMEKLAGELVAWFRSPENDRSPGNTSIKACHNLEAGTNWKLSGVINSKGCGSAVRVAPLGLLEYQQPSRLRQLARASALITHGHPAGMIAAEVTAFCVAWALEGIAPSEYLDRIEALRHSSLESWDESLGDIWQRNQFQSPLEYLTAGWDQLLAAVEKVPQTVRENVSDLCQYIGGGWVAEETLACALAAILKTPDDLKATLLCCANNGGDSDSIGCIAGAIAGAHLGTQAIPKEWKKQIENRQLLQSLAQQLFALHQKNLED